MSVDPLAEKYANISTYAYVANNPILFIDPDGKQIIIRYRDENGKKRKAKYDSEDQIFRDKKGNEISGNQFVDDVTSSLQYLSEGDEAGILDKIASDKRKVNIRETNLDGAFFSAGGFFGLGEKNVWYNPTSGVKTVDEKIAFGITGEQTIKTIETGEKQTPALGLYHELGHAFEYLFNRKEQRKRGRQEHSSYHDLEEKYIIETYENPAAKKLNEPGRNNHRGVPFNTTGPTSTDPQKGN